MKKPIFLLPLLIVSQCAASASSAVQTQDSLADLFSMDGREMITAPEHLGIINGKLTIGTPGGQVARIDGLWAPPLVSSDFALRLEILGKEVPAQVVKWRPFRLEQRGEVNGIAVSAATVLMPGKRAGMVILVLYNTTRSTLEAPLAFKTSGTLDYRGSWRFDQTKSSTVTKSAAEKSTLVLTAGQRSIVLGGTGDALTWDGEAQDRQADACASARRNRHGLLGLRPRANA